MSGGTGRRIVPWRQFASHSPTSAPRRFPLRTPIARRWVIVGLLVSLCGPASAQGTKRIGAVAGVDYSTLTGNQSSGSKTRTGFMGGLFGAISLGERVELEVEALYSMKGTDWQDVQESGTIALDYFEVPVLLRYSPEVAEGFYGLGGPTFSFNVSCRESIPSDPSAPCSDGTLRPQTTIGGVLGAGFKKSFVGAEIRIDFDLSAPLKTESGASVEVKNRVVALMLRVGK